MLVGHFLTREEAAERAGISVDEVVSRPDLLRLGGRWLEEVYFEFQFDAHGVRPDLSDLVRDLHGEFDDIEIADWLAHPNPDLNGYTPLRWRAGGWEGRRIIAAARTCGPVHGD